MANQGAKKRKEENKKHMTNLLRLVIACNVIYVLIRMLFFYSTFTWKHWVGLIVTSAAYGLSYQLLANMAKPAYSDDGELLDGGFDMTTDGMCGCDGINGTLQGKPYLHFAISNRDINETNATIVHIPYLPHYLHDVIYITSFVQVTSIISGKFWWTYAVIPAFAIYKASGLIKSLLSLGSGVGVEDEKSRKKREKMEKKASRGKIVKTRGR